MQWKEVSLLEFEGKSMKAEATASKFPNGEIPTAKLLQCLGKVNQPKRVGLWVLHSEISVGKLTSVRSFQIEKL